jgi:hypothetical protein
VIKTITLRVVPGSESDVKLLDAAKSGNAEPMRLKSTNGSAAIYARCIVRGPTTAPGEHGTSLNEYILHAVTVSAEEP